MNNATFSTFSLNQILEDVDYSKKKTKIICTMGPSCWSVENLVEMMKKGMNVARLNFSHGDHKGHGETYDRIREAQKQYKNLTCAIMLDTKGPEIRTGLLEGHKSIQLVAGQELEITSDYTFEGNNKKIACSYPQLAESLKVGSPILIADGSIVCKVQEIIENGVKVIVSNNATLGEKKNMNLPGVIVKLPTVTEKDEDDLINFGLKKNVDMIALSFTRKGSDITFVRDLLGPRGSHIKIIAKIENQEGLQNYDDILREADGIMVARGDLGMEIAPQKVFLAQKWMIKKANQVGKPIITATQMMESIINNPRPTRAEASDVANAVLDGTDCVMLSGETANGAYPLIAVETMSNICCEAELCYDNESSYYQMQRNHSLFGSKEALAISSVQLSIAINSKMIICFTASGETVRYIAKYRPQALIVAISYVDHVIKGLSITRGVICLRVPSFQGIDSLIEYAVKVGKEMNYIVTGDDVLVIQGSNEDGHNNLLKIEKVQ